MTGPFVVVDTNVVSYIIKRDTRAAEYEALLLEFPDALLSFQTMAEIEFGMDRALWGPARRSSTRRFLGRFEVMYPDPQLCRLWAQIRAFREGIGRTLHPAVAWIAALAVDLGCPVLTHNARDFFDIPGLPVITASEPS